MFVSSCLLVSQPYLEGWQGRFSRFPMEGKPWFDGRSRTQPFDIAFAAPQAAAFVGAEGENGFPEKSKCSRKVNTGMGIVPQ